MYKILFIFSGHDSSYLLREAALEIARDYPGEISAEFMDSFEIDQNGEHFEECLCAVKDSDFVFIAMHGGIAYFKCFDSIAKELEGKKKFFIYSGVEEENTILLKKTGLDGAAYNEILRYYLMGGMENCRNMILCTASVSGCGNYPYNSPEKPCWEGIYHPDREIGEPERYLNELLESGKPVIGMLFYSKYRHENNTRHIDALIRKIEESGGAVLAVYTMSVPDVSVGSRGICWTLEHLLSCGGKPVADVIINTTAYSQSILGNPGDGSTRVEKSVFENYGVPVLQAMVTWQELESWKQSLRGLDPMSLAASVYYPEFDGQIITAPIAYIRKVKDRAGERNVFMPIDERVEKIGNLAMNWARLKRMSAGEKKVAVLFHNMPPRNDMIGCAYGLDSPASVFNMINALKREGIKTEYDFDDGDDIIKRIINAVSNDMRWLPPEKIMERSVGIVEGELYREWFSKFSGPVREKMTEDWGSPPGEFMVYEDRLPVPGIINGNIFIGLQPARGFEEKAEEVYHSTDIVPPHQYMAYYKWIKHVFGAHVVVHVGTHGTLEWLPGKEAGISGECYPDMAIDDIPHLYPYIINVPGEGIQVKRRSYGVVLDHLIPSLTMSGTYGGLTGLDDLLKQYYQAKQGDRGKLPTLEDMIVKAVMENNIHVDMNTDYETMRADFSLFIDRLHAWVEQIKASFIKDGLHVFGKPPEGERLSNLVYALTRLSNGDVPPLQEAVCAAMGLDCARLKSSVQETECGGKTSLMLLDEADERCRKLVEGLVLYSDGTPDSINELCLKELPGASGEFLGQVAKCLGFIQKTILPKLSDTTDEIKYFIEGINGRFVPPGGSGCPTRGKVGILPTGRNFYSIDPAAVPTRAAWEVGKRLGDGLLERYMRDEGKYPENIVIVVYSGETMKTCGDDIAEVLYLMGIRPRWLEGTDRVTGVEVIPPEELKRPRIDVTLRITGLFRDTFPNIVEMVDDAVNLAAGLEEAESLNYVRKHIREEIKALVESGASEEDAGMQAGMRIFGCPAGTYGAGVDILINSRNWKETSDLGNVYTLWGGNAYGRKYHGIKARDAFARRLTAADATVKNESSFEIDMLDSDDFYNYHGGLIAAVRTHSGKMPRSYSGDSSDPSRTKIRDVKEETARIMRARIMNPKWFEGLKEHGYKGAQEISAMVDIVFGWDATADVVEDWMYDKISETYLMDRDRREWMQSVNPWAVHNMLQRLLEANQRGMWKAREETLESLRELYLGIEGSIEDTL